MTCPAKEEIDAYRGLAKSNSSRRRRRRKRRKGRSGE